MSILKTIRNQLLRGVSCAAEAGPLREVLAALAA
jgi:hypothetical protein